MMEENLEYFNQQNLLNYFEAVKCYENVKLIFQNKNSPKEKLLGLYKCKVQLEKLINSEEKTEIFCLNVLNQLKWQCDKYINQIEKQLFSNAADNAGIIDENSNAENIIKHDFFNLKTTKQLSPTSLRKSKFFDIINNSKLEPQVKGFKEVAGLKNVKNILRTLVILPLHQPQLYTGRKTSNCILLFGPPGTGKTRIAHAIAAEAKADLYAFTASDIMSSYVGESEKILQAIFNFARNKQECTVIFIDEIDGLCKHRDESENHYSRRIKTEFMCQLTNFEGTKNVFLLCATNCPWDLDVAFIRRFHKRIYVPLPDKQERLEFLHLFTKNTDLEKCSNFWELIVEKTDGYSGSDLTNMITHALNIPLYELENVKVWRLVDEKYYTPMGEAISYDKIVCCDITELPPNSVKSRDVEIVDLLEAIDKVKKTVPSSQIVRYKNYIDVM